MADWLLGVNSGGILDAALEARQLVSAVRNEILSFVFMRNTTHTGRPPALLYSFVD